MTTSSTQLGYLDLAAFYMQAKSVRAYFGASGNSGAQRSSILDLCDKLMCVIDAIRADGLDPRWQPERDALRDVLFNDFGIGIKPENFIKRLHQRGYKIVKDEAP